MDEYIKREKAIAKFDEIKKSGVSLRDAVYLDAVMAVLDNIETEDVSPIVRCKDCKHFGHEIADGKHACNNYQLPYCMPEDFCSYGEKKGDYEI